jgi:hypothetical protein
VSAVDSVFLAMSGGVRDVGCWAESAGGETLVATADSVRLRLRGESGERWFGVVVQPNGYVDPDPEPEDGQAMDRYAVEVQVRGVSYEELYQQAGRLFETLIAAHPDVPALPFHNLDTLVSAYLPGAGMHTFDGPTTPDAADIDTWHPWVKY